MGLPICRWLDGCGRKLVPLTRSGLRSDDLPPGHAVHGGRGLCRTHHRYAADRNELHIYPRLSRTAAEVVALWLPLQRAGHTYASAAAMLGMSPAGLRSALARGRAPAPRKRPTRSRKYFDPDTLDEGEETA